MFVCVYACVYVCVYLYVCKYICVYVHYMCVCVCGEQAHLLLTQCVLLVPPDGIWRVAQCDVVANRVRVVMDDHELVVSASLLSDRWLSVCIYMSMHWCTDIYICICIYTYMHIHVLYIHNIFYFLLSPIPSFPFDNGPSASYLSWPSWVVPTRGRSQHTTRLPLHLSDINVPQQAWTNCLSEVRWFYQMCA